MESKKSEEIKKKAEADASNILKGAEQKGRQIIEDAKKKADAEASKTFKEAEQKGRLIIEEAKKRPTPRQVRPLRTLNKKDA